MHRHASRMFPMMESQLAKGQQKSNRETKKPKQIKKAAPVAASPFAAGNTGKSDVPGKKK